jgi:hypothetical protein
MVLPIKMHPNQGFGAECRFNVLDQDFAGGADPTGVADSTAAINAAFAAIRAAVSTSHVPEGMAPKLVIPYGLSGSTGAKKYAIPSSLLDTESINRCSSRFRGILDRVRGQQ